MSGRFVRASKYRHVYGRQSRREACYDNLRVSKNAFDTNLVKANPKYLSVNWDASGGGAFAVVPLEEKGKLPDQIPLFRGHTAAVLDTDWSPFDDSLVASGSDDGKVFLWKVPEDFTLFTDAEEPADVAPVGKLSGHARKVGQIAFNPAAENILASSSGDYTIKIWDLEDGKSKMQLKHGDIIQSLSWSANGSMLATTSRDKKLRFWDVRQQRPAHEVAGHTGAKNSRAVWMGDLDRIATTGFSKMSERQLGLWDIREPTKPVGGDFMLLDSGTGISMPFWDDGSQMLYLAGKGDGNIRYYEYDNDKFEYLDSFKSPEPQRGMAFMPKRGVNTHDNEVMRAFKTVNDIYVEPISFIVPRRAETFQEDIFPPATGTKPAVSSAEWLEGKTGLPAKLNMADMYEGVAPAEIAAEEAPKAAPAKVAPPPTTTTTTSSSTPAVKSPVEPSPPRSPATGSMADNKQSMSAMASKFADNSAAADNNDDNASTSSFEEVQKPVDRSAARAAAPTPSSSSTTTASAPAPAPAPAAAPVSAPTPSSSTPSASSATQTPAPHAAPTVKPTDDSEASAPASAPSTAAAAGGLKDVLHEIRGMLVSQGKQIEELTREVGELKAAR